MTSWPELFVGNTPRRQPGEGSLWGQGFLSIVGDAAGQGWSCGREHRSDGVPPKWWGTI